MICFAFANMSLRILKVSELLVTLTGMANSLPTNSTNLEVKSRALNAGRFAPLATKVIQTHPGVLFLLGQVFNF